ncbi:MAG: DUF3396 domain-containing protein [Polyangiaceae bacterium]
MSSAWQSDKPIVHDKELDIPVLYPALGVSLHLESLTPADQPALEKANELVLGWLGPHLRWTYNSAFPVMQPFRPSDLDYAQGFTRLLDTRLQGLPAEAHAGAINLRASLVWDFSIDCHGGELETAGSPFQYRFFATVGDSPQPEDILPARAVVRVLVPCTWPLDDFRARSIELARALPVRWGNAGLAFAGWELSWYREVYTGVFAHSRRYPGFDVGKYTDLMNELHHAMRTVSWLNFVGPSLSAVLAEKGQPPAPTDVLSVSREGDLTIVQAGAAPEPGDNNRLEVPRAYVQADAALRPIRLKPPIDFHGAWDEGTTEAWLTRFERRWE